MRMFRPNWSWLVTTSQRVVIIVLLAGLGLTIGIPSLADAIDLRRKFYLTNDDSGSGPPSNLSGWIRTGVSPSNSGGAGNANCFNWTSSNGSDEGTFVFLEPTWPGSSTAISPWQAFATNTNVLNPVILSLRCSEVISNEFNGFVVHMSLVMTRNLLRLY